MTDNETKKEYLKQYENKCKKLRSIEEQRDTLIESKRSAKTQILSDMPKGSKQMDLSDYIVQCEVLLTEIIKLRNECMSMMINIEARILAMPDGLQSSILHKRYIQFMTWEQICVDIGYCWKQTHRLHSRALNNINMT